MNIDKIIKDYLSIKNVWKVGELHGLTGQRVHSILKRNKVDTTIKGKWTADQEKELIEIYSSNFKFGSKCLDLFCNKHNKLKSNVCRKAKLLGLKTNQRRCTTDEIKKAISIRAKKMIEKNGHPKGMLGKTHSDEEKIKMSIRFKALWADKNSKFNSEEHRQALSDRGVIAMAKRLSETNSVHSKSKKGYINIGGKTIFVRSTWEANIAAYFQFLKDRGAILEWEYEPRTFWFTNIKRGVRSYKPDFYITDTNGKCYFEEVKGWMDPKSKTKIKRMAKYYPEIDLRILDQKRYNSIKLTKDLIPNWGLLG